MPNQNEQSGSSSSNRGFASMDEQQKRDTASKGGQGQGRENNPGNFANDREKAAEAGRKGGQSRQGSGSGSSSEEDSE